LVVGIIGCAPDKRSPGGGGGPDGGGGDGSGGGNSDCADGTELVYVIDQLNNKLSQFDPSTKVFHDLGSLSCPTMFGATPFSMGVDRSGRAWVLYNSGELFQVTISGLACTRTSWASPNGLEVFGMGFSTDQAGGSEETLYIGGAATQTASSFTIAAVNPTTMSATPLGNQPILPEMTGTGNAELWGYMPDASTARVVKFDKATGTVAKVYPEPTLAGDMAGYAFAHWGGDFWVFLIRTGESSSSVYQVDGQSGAIKSTTPAPGRTIVGAGVSTCAPTVLL
jgi:hypothetical protein